MPRSENACPPRLLAMLASLSPLRRVYGRTLTSNWYACTLRERLLRAGATAEACGAEARGTVTASSCPSAFSAIPAYSLLLQPATKAEGHDAALQVSCSVGLARSGRLGHVKQLDLSCLGYVHCM